MIDMQAWSIVREYVSVGTTRPTEHWLMYFGSLQVDDWWKMKQQRSILE